MTGRRLLTPEAKCLLDAADLIERDGWCQGTLENHRGARCAWGAMNAAVRDVDVLGEALTKLTSYIGFIDVPTWNDCPERTREQVVFALREAALS